VHRRHILWSIMILSSYPSDAIPPTLSLRRSPRPRLPMTLLQFPEDDEVKEVEVLADDEIDVDDKAAEAAADADEASEPAAAKTVSGLLLAQLQQVGLADIMTKCVKPLRHLETSSSKSSKWSVLFGRAGTKSDYVALSQTKCLSGFTHFVILAT